MANIETLNPPNEMPDIVGEKPANPFLGSFKPHVPASARIRELTPIPFIVGTLLGIVFGRVLALSRAQSRIDGQRLNSGRRSFHHDLSNVFEDWSARRDDSRK